jgi:hypothetical protein
MADKAVYFLQPTTVCRHNKNWCDVLVLCFHIVTDLINSLPGISSINMIQHTTIEEAVFSVDLTDVPVDWLDSDRGRCGYCTSTSILWLYNESREL